MIFNRERNLEEKKINLHNRGCRQGDRRNRDLTDRIKIEKMIKIVFQKL